jgi:hypothetical protein
MGASFVTVCHPYSPGNKGKNVSIELYLRCRRCRCTCMHLSIESGPDYTDQAIFALHEHRCLFRYWPAVMIAGRKMASPTLEPGVPPESTTQATRGNVEVELPASPTRRQTRKARPRGGMGFGHTVEDA